LDGRGANRKRSAQLANSTLADLSGVPVTRNKSLPCASRRRSNDSAVHRVVSKEAATCESQGACAPRRCVHLRKEARCRTKPYRRATEAVRAASFNPISKV